MDSTVKKVVKATSSVYLDEYLETLLIAFKRQSEFKILKTNRTLKLATLITILDELEKQVKKRKFTCLNSYYSMLGGI